MHKEGPAFDLPIALSYLAAADDIRFRGDDYVFIGELSLDGALRSVRGILPLVAEAKKRGTRAVFVPRENAREAALVGGIDVFGASNLREVIDHINMKKERGGEAGGAEKTEKKKLEPTPRTELVPSEYEVPFMFEDIHGQESAKRAAIIAAAGGHNLGLSGPPGTGKTMLAGRSRRFCLR